MGIQRQVRQVSAIVCATFGIVGLLDAQAPLVPRGTGVIAGVVRDEAGQPVVYASVSVVRRFKYWNGPYYMASTVSHHDETDDRGEFRLHSLPAGTYVVAVTVSRSPGAEPVRSDGTGYLTTFFPGTPSLSDARTITVEDHTEQSITIRLPAVKMTTVSGTVLRADGSPAVGYSVALLGTPSVAGSLAQSPGMNPTTAGSGVSPTGGFELKGVPAGAYTLQVSNFYGGRKTGDAREIARLPIGVSEAPIRDVKLTTGPGAIARGRVVWDDKSSERLGVSRVRAVLIGSGYLEDATVQSDGTFELSGLYGSARFEVIGYPAVTAVQAPAAITVSRYLLNFAPGTVVEDIKIVMTRRVGRFMATVIDETQKPFTRGSVLLMPPQPDMGAEIGTHPGSAGMGFLPTGGNDRGEYAIEHVLPGAYLAVAIDIPPYLINLDSDLMERARAAAVPIQLAPGEQRQTLHAVRLQSFVRVGVTDTGPVVR